MDDATTFLNADPFSKQLGIRLISSSPGKSTLHLDISENHLNSHGTVHGGVIFSLADVAFAVASNTSGIPAVAINTSITYMKAASSGTLIAEANEFSSNPKLGSYVVEVYDQNREKIAVFQGLAYRKSPRK
ncbi:PaaI family thioesterase [Methanospirillum lacunae]|uniref:Phenylacetic acid degradation protein n=1 Tax=Methanospirillum lacunae TaxID=668570 RepID=A0A2V2NH74_9EURY|nr:hotdog fold thioesterase [Methanospirillum lacunae]PWR74683.1 phenylacetic acid degradation protein [Methanospirillum lacunae]